MAGLLIKLGAAIVKYGSKAVKCIKAAWVVIKPYGKKAIDWIVSHKGMVIAAIGSANDVKDFVEWISELLANLF